MNFIKKINIKRKKEVRIMSDTLTHQERNTLSDLLCQTESLSSEEKENCDFLFGRFNKDGIYNNLHRDLYDREFSFSVRQTIYELVWTSLL